MGDSTHLYLDRAGISLTSTFSASRPLSILSNVILRGTTLAYDFLGHEGFAVCSSWCSLVAEGVFSILVHMENRISDFHFQIAEERKNRKGHCRRPSRHDPAERIQLFTLIHHHPTTHTDEMVKVAVLGAAGGIGQPLSLLLKTNPLVTGLGLYDIVNTPGVAADLSHIATPAKVEGYLEPDDGLKKALTGAEVVIIPAGVPRKPGMSRDDLFQINAGIVRGLANGVATTCPKAFVLVISNPVNSTVPIVAEVFKGHGVFDPKRLFGVTTLDVVRASTFVAELLNDRSAASSVVVPVVGGHSGVTIVPLLSQSSHPLPSGVDIDALVHRIQFGGDEVVKAKDGAGSATLSMAYAGYEFAVKIIKAVNGEKGIVAPSYVSLTADPTGGEALTKELGTALEFFSSRVELGPEGVAKIYPLGQISDAEKKLIKAAIPDLKTNIQTGFDFIKKANL
uniref:malate dehydrogenase n=1 Tax=Moniliophthora roreri TaxID=221103 RepID=A0A0W0FDL3_MONRR